MNSTIEYYNDHAESYFMETVGIDLDAVRIRFASYLPAEARVIDMGCGSGRDVMAFSNMGHYAVGLDSSEKLVALAKERLEIKAFAADMSSWISPEPYDGIWCCASLIHLTEEECGRFFYNLRRNLKSGGAIYISVKSGIETGLDERGRYFRNFTEEDLRGLMSTVPGLEIRELWYTGDAMGRGGFRWLNTIGVKS